LVSDPGWESRRQRAQGRGRSVSSLSNLAPLTWEGVAFTVHAGIDPGSAVQVKRKGERKRLTR